MFTAAVVTAWVTCILYYSCILHRCTSLHVLSFLFSISVTFHTLVNRWQCFPTHSQPEVTQTQNKSQLLCLYAIIICSEVGVVTMICLLSSWDKATHIPALGCVVLDGSAHKYHLHPHPSSSWLREPMLGFDDWWQHNCLQVNLGNPQSCWLSAGPPAREHAGNHTEMVSLHLSWTGWTTLCPSFSGDAPLGRL